MDKDTAIKVCQLIAGIVIADDDLDPAEEAFIERMLAKFGLPSTDRDALFPIADANDAKNAIQELTPEVQSQALELLVQAAAADGAIAEEEKDYLDLLAKAIGTSETKLDEMIAAALA